jgi:hypothetical protein
MFKLLWVEDPVKGIFSLEFLGPCHINADARLISAESSPDLSSTIAEGDGRTPIFSQQKMGPAKEATDHLNWERSSSTGGLTAFPKGALHGHKVIPQGRDEAALVTCPVRPAPLEGFVGDWHGCIKDGSPSMNEIHGVNG